MDGLVPKLCLLLDCEPKTLAKALENPDNSQALNARLFNRRVSSEIFSPFVIEDITKRLNSRNIICSYFPVKLTLEDSIRTMYKVDLKYPDLPVLISSFQGSRMYCPMELVDFHYDYEKGEFGGCMKCTNPLCPENICT